MFSKFANKDQFRSYYIIRLQLKNGDLIEWKCPKYIKKRFVSFFSKKVLVFKKKQKSNNIQISKSDIETIDNCILALDSTTDNLNYNAILFFEKSVNEGSTDNDFQISESLRSFIQFKENPQELEWKIY